MNNDFQFAKFMARNPLYATKSWRNLSKVRRNMAEFRELNPTCAFCGRTKNIHIHHIVPIWANPLLAWITTNFISLCSKCHLYIGHNGDYGSRYCMNVDLICNDNQVVKKLP